MKTAATWYTCCNPVILMHEDFSPLVVATLEPGATPGCKKGAMRRTIQSGGETVGEKSKFIEHFVFLSFLFLSSKMNSLGGILACVTQRPTVT